MSVSKVGVECCGCRTCKVVCKFHAISMITDRYGFEQIRVETDLCRECGICEDVCPVLHVETGEGRYSCGAAYALNEDIKFHGSSGGLFGVFADKVISEGGCVYGAAFDTHLKLKTTMAETKEKLLPLFKSKYLLCDTGNSFVEMKEWLDRGRKVLYCSSPCQIAALKRFLGWEYDNLLTVDFVCHGVGSQTLFDQSIRYSEKKMSVSIQKVTFRYKAKKASSHCYQYKYRKKQKNLEKQDLYLSFPYYNAYCKQLVCRENCYACKYATEERGTDITIGDFHTIEKYNAAIDRFAGVSMFVCNTLKGEQFFNSVKQELYVEIFPWDVLRKNNRFHKGGKAPKNRQEFMESIAADSFDQTVEKYLKPSKDWKRLIYYKSPAILRKIVRKIKE